VVFSLLRGFGGKKTESKGEFWVLKDVFLIFIIMLGAILDRWKK
jgi:hypothetical protein